MFRDRKDAGIQLARRLEHYRGLSETLVLALPRGGIVTAAEVARHLGSPLDVLIIRKLGAPGQPELALGAISETGTVVLNESLIKVLGIPDEYLQREISRQSEEAARRVELYRQGSAISALEGRTVILVDDGVATGATVKAAVATLKRERIGRMVVALPVASPEAVRELGSLTDELVCLEIPLYFISVGSYYDRFPEVMDNAVVDILQQARAAERV